MGFFLIGFAIGMINGLTEGTYRFDIGLIGKTHSRCGDKIFGYGIGLHLVVYHILVEGIMGFDSMVNTVNVPHVWILG